MPADSDPSSSPEPAPPAAAPWPPAGLAEAGLYPSERAADQHGLVVLAMGLEYWNFALADGWHLLVTASALPAVREQLARFDRESVGWPPRPAPAAPPARPVDFRPALLWVAAVLLAWLGQHLWPLTWPSRGALESTALFDRAEIWRPFTALFLHADTGHLVGNLIAGYGVFAAVGATCGQTRGWALLALAAILGNSVSAALHYPELYRSLGASTAIFAGLGLLTGRASRALSSALTAPPWRALLLPLATGAVLLALYGGGSPSPEVPTRTDLLAHAAGFASGLVLGFLFGLPPKTRGTT